MLPFSKTFVFLNYKFLTCSKVFWLSFEAFRQNVCVKFNLESRYFIKRKCMEFLSLFWCCAFFVNLRLVGMIFHGVGGWQLLKELKAPVEFIVLPTFAYEHKIFVGPFSRKFPKAQVWVAPRQWSWPINLPVQLFGIFKPKILRDDNYSAPWADEIDQKVLSCPVGKCNCVPESDILWKFYRSALDCIAVLWVYLSYWSFYKNIKKTDMNWIQSVWLGMRMVCNSLLFWFLVCVNPGATPGASYRELLSGHPSSKFFEFKMKDDVSSKGWGILNILILSWNYQMGPSC